MKTQEISLYLLLVQSSGLLIYAAFIGLNMKDVLKSLIYINDGKMRYLLSAALAGICFVCAKAESEVTPSADLGLIAGEWTVYSVRGDKVSGEDRPYIDIQPGGDRFYGYNGCNVLNGDVAVSGSDGISFTNIISTQRFCDNAPFEYPINIALNDARRYVLKRDGHESYMELLNDSGRVILVLRHHNMDFLNGAWRVVEIDGETNMNENMEVVIDIPQAKVHGNAGCNILNGGIFIDPDKDNSIQFQDIVTTRSSCQDMSLETSFLVALEEVETASRSGSDDVVMYDGRGREVIRLKRIYIDTLGGVSR